MIIKRKCVSTRIFLWIIGLIFIFPHRRLFPYKFPGSPKTEHIPACFDHAVPDWNFNKLRYVKTLRLVLFILSFYRQAEITFSLALLNPAC